MKIGFLGGSFDPVHFGHLIVAQDVLEQFQLEAVRVEPWQVEYDLARGRKKL